jgi:hypothetical protein
MISSKKLEIIKVFLETERPDLNLTKTSQRQDVITRKLQRKLDSILKELRDRAINSNRQYLVMTQHDNDLVRKEIKLSVEDAYLTSLKYVHSTDTRLPISQKDLDRIEQTTNVIFNRFKSLVHRTTIELQEFGFDLLASYIQSLISNAITAAINSATTSHHTLDYPELNNPVDFTPRAVIEVEFVTRRDAKVCPICDALDGTRYEIGDETKPQIPDDTHPNCRCRYLRVTADGMTQVG